MPDSLDVKELAAAAVSVGAGAIAFASSMHWPTALLIVAVGGLTTTLFGMIRRDLARQAAEIAALKIERHECTADLQRAHVAIARLHSMLVQSSGRRRCTIPPLAELFSDQADDAMDRVQAMLGDRAAVANPPANP